MMVRLAASVWVQAYLLRLRQEGIPAFVVYHGDDTAGVVLVKSNTLDGQARLFERGFDVQTGGRSWVEMAAGAEADIDAVIAKQRDFDNDLWVLEVEDRAGRTLLDQPGIAD